MFRLSSRTNNSICPNQPILNKATNSLQASILINTNPKPNQAPRSMLTLNNFSLTNGRNTSKPPPKVLSPVHTPNRGGNNQRQDPPPTAHQQPKGR